MGVKDVQPAGTAPLGERFERALVMAHRLHARQRRKGTEIPYIAHLLAVCALVLEAGGTEDEAIGALLHDAAEDQGGAATLAEIERVFGRPVADIVRGCSDHVEGEGGTRLPWRQRKERYLRHLVHAPASILIVSLADKTHNARAIRDDHERIGEALWERFSGGRKGVLWYYRALVDAYEKAPAMAEDPRLPPMHERLDRIVSSLERACARQWRGDGAA